MATYAIMPPDEIEHRLLEADNAQKQWAKWSVAKRVALLKDLAVVLRRHRSTAAAMITQEMGKLYRESLAEIDKCISLCGYYQEHAAAGLAMKPLSTVNDFCGVKPDPLGVILGIMPWNFPFWQAFRFMIPTLIAGNAVALKHASNVTGCALKIGEIFAEAGFPKGLIQVLVLPGAQMDVVIQHHVVKGVSLTGSEAVGKQVAEIAGKRLLPMVLELGGSDPFLVFHDADLEMAIQIAVQSRMQNAGQSCIAAKRFIVHESVYDEFVRGVMLKMGDFVLGDPMHENTTLAPLALPHFVNELHDLVESSRQMGADILMGANLDEVKPGFYPPTIVSNIPLNAPLAQEEAFGPVMGLYAFSELDEAIELANGTRFGLGATIFSESLEIKHHCLNNIVAGSVYINGLMRSNPALPFGGVKASGHGRELGLAGLLAFTNEKTYWSNEPI